VVERHAESAEVLQEDEESVKLRANVLPPVQRRVGLVLLIAGPDAFVTEPAGLRYAATLPANCLRTMRLTLARRLDPDRTASARGRAAGGSFGETSGQKRCSPGVPTIAALQRSSAKAATARLSGGQGRRGRRHQGS
jgi:hypothetical protein